MTARPDTPEHAQWARFARADLLAARALASIEGIDPSEVCVLSHQAAEKALKAAIAEQGVRVPRTHNLKELRALIPGALRGEADDLALRELSDWYTAGRYPGDWTEPTEEDAAASLTTAEAVTAAVFARLRIPEVPE